MFMAIRGAIAPLWIRHCIRKALNSHVDGYLFESGRRESNFSNFLSQMLSNFRDLGQRIAAATAEPRSFQFLMQRVSVAVLRGGAACVVGTVPSAVDWDDVC
jgi:hypothetical protein